MWIATSTDNIRRRLRMKFFLKAWSRFAPAVAIALFFVPLIAQASSDFHGQACSCGFDKPFKYCPC
jgi:hypothetical protein